MDLDTSDPKISQGWSTTLRALSPQIRFQLLTTAFSQLTSTCAMTNPTRTGCFWTMHPTLRTRSSSQRQARAAWLSLPNISLTPGAPMRTRVFPFQTTRSRNGKSSSWWSVSFLAGFADRSDSRQSWIGPKCKIMRKAKVRVSVINGGF